MAQVLVTGGAGFIGSHLVDALVARGDRVRVLDCLDPQAHPTPPTHLHPKAEYLRQDITDPKVLPKALEGAEVVYHLAAAVGIAQSNYRISHFVRTNTQATADLLQYLADQKPPLKRLVVASSNTIYGEGAYGCPSCGEVYPRVRPEAQLRAKDWELKCPKCGRTVSPRPTSESKPLAPTSIYAITKRDEEEMCLAFGAAYQVPVAALRFFSVYGPRQTLSNPYTGVAAIFLARVRNGHSPIIYEDGKQSRDFVSVHDAVRALLLATDRPQAIGRAINIGSGRSITIQEVADLLMEIEGRKLPVQLNGEFRTGDIRHCTGDISLAKELLGYSPQVPFREGLREFLEWSAGEKVEDRVEVAHRELSERGLARH